jgi:hypothetical protein
MTKTVKSLDDLERGIKQLLLENRCSFSDEERIILNDCISSIQQSKKINKKSGKPDLSAVAKVVEILLKLMVISEHLRDLF